MTLGDDLSPAPDRPGPGGRARPPGQGRAVAPRSVTSRPPSRTSCRPASSRRTPDVRRAAVASRRRAGPACATATPGRPASWPASTSSWPARPGRRTPWPGRCAPWPPSTPAPTGSSTCSAPGPCWPGPWPTRLVGPDRHRPGRAAAAHPRPGRRGASARPAALGRGPRRPRRSCGRCRAGSAGCSTGSASSRARCRPRRMAALTVSERRVARMAADGLTNRQIAERARGHGQGRRVAPLARLPQARHLLAGQPGRRRSARRSDALDDPRLSACRSDCSTPSADGGPRPARGRPRRDAARAALRPDLRRSRSAPPPTSWRTSSPRTTSRDGVVGFCFATFAVSWAWINFSWFASAYDTDDWIFRLTTMVQMVGVLVLALGPAADVRVAAATATTSTTQLMVLGYVVMRVPMLFQWLRAGQRGPGRAAQVCRVMIATLLVAQVGWILLAARPTSTTGWTFACVAGLLILVEPPARSSPSQLRGGTPVARPPHRRAVRPDGDHRPRRGAARHDGRARRADRGRLDHRGRRARLSPGSALTFGMWWTYFVIPQRPPARRAPRALLRLGLRAHPALRRAWSPSAPGCTSRRTTSSTTRSSPPPGRVLTRRGPAGRLRRLPLRCSTRRSRRTIDPFHLLLIALSAGGPGRCPS